MKKDEIAKAVYEKLKQEDVDSVISLLSNGLKNEKTDQLRFTKTPLLNSIGDELGKLLEKEGEKFDWLAELWKKGDRDEKLVVISALGRISKKDYGGSKLFTLNIIDDLQNWELCDQLALRVVVNLVVHDKDGMFSLMNLWIKSKNKWIRRLAVATIPPYIRAKKSESKSCLEFLDKVMLDRDKDVKKAVGWALREISKKDSDGVFDFIHRWAKQKDRNVKCIIKEGIKKLPEEKQNILKSMISG